MGKFGIFMLVVGGILFGCPKDVGSKQFPRRPLDTPKTQSITKALRILVPLCIRRNFGW